MNVKQRLAALKKPAKKVVTPVPQRTKPRAAHVSAQKSAQSKVVAAPVRKTAPPPPPPVKRKGTKPPAPSTNIQQRVEEAKTTLSVAQPLRAPAPIVFPVTPPVPATLEEAIKLSHKYGIMSTGILQDRMAINYAVAVRLLDTLEREGVVAKDEGLLFHGHGYRRVCNQGGC